MPSNDLIELSGNNEDKHLLNKNKDKTEETKEKGVETQGLKNEGNNTNSLPRSVAHMRQGHVSDSLSVKRPQGSQWRVHAMPAFHAHHTPDFAVGVGVQDP